MPINHDLIENVLVTLSEDMKDVLIVTIYVDNNKHVMLSNAEDEISKVILEAIVEEMSERLEVRH